MRVYTKSKGTILRSKGWFTASYNVAAGNISKDFRTEDEAQQFLNKKGR